MAENTLFPNYKLLMVLGEEWVLILRIMRIDVYSKKITTHINALCGKLQSSRMLSMWYMKEPLCFKR